MPQTGQGGNSRCGLDPSCGEPAADSVPAPVTAGEEDWPSPEELDHMQSWSLTVRLAALPPSMVGRLEGELARIARGAQDVHPLVAQKAAEREQRGEPPAFEV